MFPPIEQLLPHQGPAILLSRVLSFDSSTVTCESVVHAEMQYVDGGGADAALALELMAQAVSAYVGLEGRSVGQTPREGYIVGVPRMEFFGGDYRVGDLLRIVARVQFRESPVGRFEAEVYQGETLRARGTLTVFEPTGAEESEDARHS